MSRVEIKSKLKEVIKDMLLSSLETEQNIPDALVHQILQGYGFTATERSNTKEDLDCFLKSLEKWIKDKHLLINDSSIQKSEEPDFDFSLFQKYIEAETEYCEVTIELMEVMEEMLKHKETYSQYFKDECNAQSISMEVLNKKCQFLKLQFFLKLYGEENALKGHLALRTKLKEEMISLKHNYNKLVEYNKHMEEIKNNKAFCELFKIYKELRRIEKMTEIIGNI